MVTRSVVTDQIVLDLFDGKPDGEYVVDGYHQLQNGGQPATADNPILAIAHRSFSGSLHHATHFEGWRVYRVEEGVVFDITFGQGETHDTN